MGEWLDRKDIPSTIYLGSVSKSETPIKDIMDSLKLILKESENKEK